MPAGGQWKRYTEPRSAMDTPAARGRHGVASLSGSSPCLRGTRARLAERAPHRRFIPAPAGNARSGASARRARAVHPRACGERCRVGKTTDGPFGSSPRLRGTPGFQGLTGRGGRFIPAPAGNALSLRIAVSALPVHPRACGERGFRLNAGLLVGGSSPRLRGTLQCFASLRHGSRFIPAPAGNACGATNMTREEAVHPRACGERGCSRRPMGP